MSGAFKSRREDVMCVFNYLMFHTKCSLKYQLPVLCMDVKFCLLKGYIHVRGARLCWLSLTKKWKRPSVRVSWRSSDGKQVMSEREKKAHDSKSKTRKAAQPQSCSDIWMVKLMSRLTTTVIKQLRLQGIIQWTGKIALSRVTRPTKQLRPRNSGQGEAVQQNIRRGKRLVNFMQDKTSL